MRSDKFSEFDALTVGDDVKQKTLEAIRQLKGHEKTRLKKYLLIGAPALCVTLFLVAAGININSVTHCVASKNSDTSIVSSTSNYRILSNPPAIKQQGNSDSSIAQAPSEQDLFRSSDLIVYGKVQGFHWLELENEQDSALRYQTIVTVSIINAYKGSPKAGQNVGILLPFAISGTGTGIGVEDNDDACSLKPGSEAFFFAKQYKSDDLIGDSTWNIRAAAICAYGAGFGNNNILLNRSGRFNYSFAKQSLSFQEMEQAIKKNENE